MGIIIKSPSFTVRGGGDQRQTPSCRILLTALRLLAGASRPSRSFVWTQSYLFPTMCLDAGRYSRRYVREPGTQLVKSLRREQQPLPAHCKTHNLMAASERGIRNDQNCKNLAASYLRDINCVKAIAEASTLLDVLLLVCSGKASFD